MSPREASLDRIKRLMAIEEALRPRFERGEFPGEGGADDDEDDGGLAALVRKPGPR